jgi:hypothetical protein
MQGPPPGFRNWTALKITGFDGDDRLMALSAAGDPLGRLSRAVDFGVFREDLDLERALSRSDRAKGGRPPYDAVLQTLYTLSDDQTEYQLKDQPSFMPFVGLALTRRSSRCGFSACLAQTSPPSCARSTTPNPACACSNASTRRSACVSILGAGPGQIGLQRCVYRPLEQAVWGGSDWRGYSAAMPDKARAS